MGDYCLERRRMVDTVLTTDKPMVKACRMVCVVGAICQPFRFT